MKRVTIKDIAAQIGLSPAAVSAVLKKKSKEARISPSTVRLVEETAARMGYIPNVTARDLRNASSGRPLVIALITSYEVPLTIAENILGWLERSRPHADVMDLRLSFTLEVFHRGALHALPCILDNAKFNAAVVSNTSPDDDQFLGSVRLPYPTVLVNRDIQGYSSISEDAANTGTVAAGILLGRGGRRPAVLYPAALTSTTARRMESFRRECERQLGREPFCIASRHFSAQGAFDAIDEFLSAGGEFDSIFLISDFFAPGLYEALHRRGMTIPGDVMAVGVDNIEHCRFLRPPLTTFEQMKRPFEDGTLLSMLMKQIRNPDASPERVCVTIAPILRGSTRD